MNSSMEELRNIENTIIKEREIKKDIYSFIKTIRAHKEIRDFITLESKVINPFAKRNGDNCDVYFILAIYNFKGKNLLPWGIIHFEYPSYKIVEKYDIRSIIKREKIELDTSVLIEREYTSILENSIRNNEEALKNDLKVEPIYNRIIEEFDFLKADMKNEFSIKSEKILQEVIHFSSKVSELIYRSKEENLNEKINLINAKINSSHFSIAVVGEISRGKSSIINRIIENKILPSGVMRTTKNVTIVKYGKENRACILKDNERKELNFDEKSIKEEYLKNEEKAVSIEVKNEWLAQYRLKLVDMPGIDGDKNFDETLKALTVCDAAIVVMSAEAALSMTERRFIEEYLITRKMPHIAILISKIDLVEEMERNSTIKFINEKIFNWNSKIPVYFADEINEKGELVQNVDNFRKVRDIIEKWSIDKNNLLLQGIQNKKILLNIIDELKEIEIMKKKNILLSNEEREEEIKKVDTIIDGMRLKWEELKLTATKFENDFVEEISEKWNKNREKAFTDIEFILEKTSNIKDWWEKDLKHLLRKELINSVMNVKNLITLEINSAIVRLNEKAKIDFNAICTNAKVKIKNEEIDFKIKNDVEIKDVTVVRNVFRVATAGAMVVSSFVFPIGAIISVAGGIIGEKILKSKIDLEKAKLKKVLRNEIDIIYSTTFVEINNIIKNEYSKIVVDISLTQKKWIEAYKKSLSANFKKDNLLIEEEQNIDTILKQIEKIKMNIQNSLK